MKNFKKNFINYKIYFKIKGDKNMNIVKSIAQEDIERILGNNPFIKTEGWVQSPDGFKRLYPEDPGYGIFSKTRYQRLPAGSFRRTP